MRSIVVSVVVAGVLMAMAVAACAATVESKSPLGNKDGGKRETSIGDLAADAVRAAMRCEVAFVAASELKPKDPPIPAGVVSSDQVVTVISYQDDPLALLELKGDKIRAALEKSVSIYPQTNLGFLQVSGLKFSFDPSKKAGSRLTSASIGGTELSDDRTYTVGLSNSMANGALGYWKLWSKDDVKRREADLTVAKAIESYFGSRSTIDYSNLERINAK